MKKSIILAAATVVLAAAAAVAIHANRQANPVFEANVEALMQGEATAGRICAYDINCWCIYLNPYEEYPGQFVN